jgi:FAD/FMN-containing dehydrogenase
MLDARIAKSLGEVVGDDHVIVDPDVAVSYGIDWTGRFQGTPSAVVRPADAAEVAGVVELCRTHGIAVVPQGGNTGLVGGSVPLEGELILSLRRLSSITHIDGSGGQLTAGAGTSIADVSRSAGAAGWNYGIDLASRDSATVGGTVATNAGGLRVLRYGPTRSQVLGIEAVLGTGVKISHLAGLTKDNTGYDLAGLLCGSEGTLGIVTAARLRLVPEAPMRAVALLAFPNVESAVKASMQFRQTLTDLQSLELFFEQGLALVCDVTGLPRPFVKAHPVYLLVEVAGPHDRFDEFSEVIESTAAVEDAAVAVDSLRCDQLWQYRERHTEAISTVGTPHKLDVTLPWAHLVAFIERVPDVVKESTPHATTWLFGHTGDGNIHVNITGVDPDDTRVDDAVMTLVADLGGSISAEHGIGRAKRPWLHLNRSREEIDTFRLLKDALDPQGILNPNVLLPGVNTEMTR